MREIERERDEDLANDPDFPTQEEERRLWENHDWLYAPVDLHEDESVDWDKVTSTHPEEEMKRHY